MNYPVEKFCAFCGRPFKHPEAGWPKECECGEITYRNPIPVVNVIVPVRGNIPNKTNGILLIRRGIDPCMGKWALPGGFMELGENWQEGAARELWEETTIRVDHPYESIKLYRVESNPRKSQILIFGIVPPIDPDIIHTLPTNPEVTEYMVAHEAIELAFPPHTTALASFLADK